MSREVRAETELRASPDEVWEIVMDPRRLGDWVTTHEGLEGDVPDRLEQGSTFKQRLKIGGPTFTATWNVVECDPPHRVRWEGEGPGGSKAHVEYQARTPCGDDPVYLREPLRTAGWSAGPSRWPGDRRASGET